MAFFQFQSSALLFSCCSCSQFGIVPSVRGDGQWDLQATAKDHNFPLTENSPNVNLLLFFCSFPCEVPNVCSCSTWTLKNLIEMADAPRLQLNPAQFHTAWSTGGALVAYFIIKAWKAECMCKRDFINLLLSSWCWKLRANLNSGPQNIYYYLVLQPSSSFPDLFLCLQNSDFPALVKKTWAVHWIKIKWHFGN